MEHMFITASLILAASTMIGQCTDRKVIWNGLKVTWGPDLENPNFFVDLPRTKMDAVKQGFRSISYCSNRSKFRGNRFAKGKDRSVVLLYDKNGYIAGIQTTVPSGTPSYPPEELKPPFVLHKSGYLLTAYFTDPSSVCTDGRSKTDFDKEGTGSNLYIQNSESPEILLKIPNSINDLQGTLWKGGKCIPTMGKHFWYDLRVDLDCNKAFPVFLLYNGGELTGFGWTMLTNLTSPRYEHPTLAALAMAMDPIPTCVHTMSAFTNMHIFLTKDVSLNKC